MLARGKVCYVGQPVAIVVAQDRYIARDALDLLRVDYQPLLPLWTLRRGPGQCTLCTTNLAPMWRCACGWAGDVQAAFAQADCIVRATLRRATACPGTTGMPRAGSPLRAGEQRLTLWASTQVPHKVKRYVGQLLHQPPREVRVIAPDVGGGFGQKVEIWPEDIALSYLAITLRQPIKWIEERWENMLAYHGRGYSAEVEAAARRDGTILGMRFRIIADVGGYFLNATPGPPINAPHRVAGPYAIDTMEVECLSVMTNNLHGSVSRRRRSGGRVLHGAYHRPHG